MYITVSLKIEVNATASREEMEKAIQEAGREAMKEALKKSVKASEKEHQKCPKCESELGKSEGSKQRVILTTFGRVELHLSRVRCQNCHFRYRPAGRCLKQLFGHNITNELRNLASLVGSSWPYEVAKGVLHRLTGAQVSHECLRQITNEEGTALAKEQKEQSEKMLQEAYNMHHIRQQRGKKQFDDQKKEADLLSVGFDGGWLPSREQKGGMEGKIGVIASSVEAIGKAGRHRLYPRRYVATFASSEDLGILSYAAACELGATEARKQCVLGDGAQWIKSQADQHFPEATNILDWPHLWRKMRDAVRACRPGKKAGAKAWRREVYAHILPLLWQGDVDTTLVCLQACRMLHNEPIARLEDAITYLHTQRSWIKNYEQLRADGYPVGSGLVERAVALLINRRMKKQGMRWKRDNATAIVALRAQRLNADWDSLA